ncbi:MAG: AAA family ATPase [Chloroflexi bacterium]|nr:AAA family ATPase [Chloroflexota bacterium]
MTTATELRLLDSQFGGSLEQGIISDGQLIELSDRAGTYSATLDLIILSIPALRTSITNVEIYGAIRNSESRTLDAQRELSLVVGQLNQLTGTEPTILGAVRISDVQDRTSQISDTIASSKDDLDDLISTVRPGEPIPTVGLIPLGDRFVASSEILLSLSQSVASIRAPEADVEARAKLISVEDQLQASSIALTTVSGEIAKLSDRPSALVDQSIRNASDFGRVAAETFNSAAQSLRLIRNDINAEMIIRPDRLIVLGEEFHRLEQDVMAVSTYLAQAEARENISVILTALAEARGISDELGLEIGATADDFGAIGQPSDAEATLYTQLLDSQRQLQLGRLIFDRPTASILEKAVTATSTGKDDTLANGIVGLAAGFLLGVIIVVMLEYMDKRLRGQEDIKRQLGLSPLGVIPIAAGTWNPHPQITVDSPPSTFSESLRMVRTAVDIGRRQESAQILLVTSPREGDGKTTIALNLARSMAMENKKVLLVDGNLHTPEVASAFKLEDQRGLSDALKTNSAPADYVVEVDGVHILPGGASVDNPADVLATPSFQEFLQDAKKDYDIIIMDSPPAIGYADTVILAKNSDGVIFTYKARHTSAGDAEYASQIMQSVGTPTVGVILNMAGDHDSGVVFPKVRRTTPHPPPTSGWRSSWIGSKIKRTPKSN